MEIIQNLIWDQELYLWKFVDCEHNIRLKMAQLKYDTFPLKMDGFSTKFKQMAQVFNLIENIVDKYNVHFYELLESRIELADQFHELDNILKLSCSSQQQIDFKMSTDNVDVKFELTKNLRTNTKSRLKRDKPTLDKPTLSNPQSVKENIHSATPPEKCICKICPMEFQDIHLRAQHLETVHGYVKPYPCDYCDKWFAFVGPLERHMHRKTKPLICDICCWRGATKASIEYHMIKYHSTNIKLDCEICGIECSTTNQLRIHMASHRQYKKYTCGECDEKYLKVSELTCHLREMHNKIGNFHCEKCGRQFAWQLSLKNHMARHIGSKTMQCPHCPRKYYTRFQMKRHIKESHEPRDQHKHLCNECGKTYSTISRLKTHQMTNHIKRERLACSLCEKTFCSVAALRMHIKRHKTGPSYKVCDICQVTLSSAGSLLNHKKTVHATSRPHSCAACGKSFTTFNHLSEHTKIHVGAHAFVCDICLKGFHGKHDMATHRRIHTGEKPFPCPHCQRKFSDRRNMIKHIKVHDVK